MATEAASVSFFVIEDLNADPHGQMRVAIIAHSNGETKIDWQV